MYFQIYFRMSLPLKVLEKQKGNSTNVWMTNMLDKYKLRPSTAKFELMSLAHFAANYKVSNANKNTKADNTIRLLDDKTSIKVRKKTAVIRFAKYNKDKEPEKHFASILTLYYPHRGPVLPSFFKTFTEYYHNGTVPTKKGDLPIKTLVQQEMEKFTKMNKVEELIDEMAEFQNLEDAWQQIAPCAEFERAKLQPPHCDGEEEALSPRDFSFVNHQIIPNLHINHNCTFAVEQSKAQMISSREAYELKSKLNSKQRAIFNHVRSWCFALKHNKHPQPMRLFITGGAGKILITRLPLNQLTQ